MIVTDIIAKKRDGGGLTAEEIGFVVREFTAGGMADGPMGALLMAIVLNGMSRRETAALTFAMRDSGETLDLSSIPGVKVDKHSTGGVGDKTTLVVAPLVAALGVRVPKMSGRALGHTGGTIDKLECFPGLTTALSPDRFRRQVADIGVAIACQTESIAPADKRIYALRDQTATVESIPLIAASVMSKKLAVGADALVLDVKAGTGALVTGEAGARELAETMVDIGRQAGKRVTAVVTNMDQPLGAAVGDAVEVVEALETLAGSGPRDFAALCEVIAGHMLALGGAAAGPEEGRVRAREGLASGVGLAKLRELVRAQGGSVEPIERPEVLLQGVQRTEVPAAGSGFVTGIEAREIGLAVRDLKAAAGAEKRRCGVLLHMHTGDEPRGRPVATVIAPSGRDVSAAVSRVAGAFRFGAAPPPPAPLVIATIGAGTGPERGGRPAGAGRHTEDGGSDRRGEGLPHAPPRDPSVAAPGPGVEH
jgi:pyrimidine-nucleoside phosphorylase